MRLTKRLLTATGLATMFAVGLAAQATTGTAATGGQDPQTTTAAGQGRGGGPRTLTGCLRAGDTAGTYMLTNVEGTATATGTGAATGGGQGRGGMRSMTVTSIKMISDNCS